MAVHACLTHPCPVCMGQAPAVVADIVVMPEVGKPHSPWAEVEEATPADCVNIARRRIEAALREVGDDASHTADHVRMYLTDALAWLPDNLPAEPKHAARPPHPATMAGR